MAHPVQQEWCKEIKKRFPHHFKNTKVIDIGSLDINGNNKHLFKECEYIGVDVIEGKNVDIISAAHKLDFKDESFDVVISTNALEHDMHLELTLQKMVRLLKPKGLLFLSAAHSWNEHGTLETSPSQSGTTKVSKKWASYYKNVTIEDILEINLQEFKEYGIEVFKKDIRFYGVKMAKSKILDPNEIISVENAYKFYCNNPSDIYKHLPTLVDYATKIHRITELGVGSGRSTVAWFFSLPISLHCYDIGQRKRLPMKLFRTWAKKHNIHFEFILQDSLTIDIAPTDLLFLDTLHTYKQVKQELEMHSEKVSKYIIIHDTETFGKVGMDKKKPGVEQAIIEFVSDSNNSWQIEKIYRNNNGLTILKNHAQE